MSYGQMPRADIPTPPAQRVDWKVRMPPLEQVEYVDPKLLVITPETKKQTISNHIPRAAYVIARTWFEARAQAARYWARRGVHFNPQSIREGEVLA